MTDCRIPEIPFASGVEQNLQRMLAPIKETLDIWAGRIGDPLCRHVTIEDLLDEAITVNIIGGGGSGTPSAHASTHVTGGSDVIANAVPAGNAGLMNGADKTNLDTLSDNSIADALHRHSELVASDGSPDPALSVDAGGNVGIGIPTPNSRLHIKAGTPGTVGDYPAGQLIIQNPAQSSWANIVITGYRSDANGDPSQQLWYLGSTSSGNSHIALINRRNSSLHLGTYNTTRMTILGNGNVGIGTDVPSEALDINSDAIRIRTTQTPASATASGTMGQICWDANYIYICTATNTWKRTAILTW